MPRHRGMCPPGCICKTFIPPDPDDTDVYVDVSDLLTTLRELACCMRRAPDMSAPVERFKECIAAIDVVVDREFAVPSRPRNCRFLFAVGTYLGRARMAAIIADRVLACIHFRTESAHLKDAVAELDRALAYIIDKAPRDTTAIIAG